MKTLALFFVTCIGLSVHAQKQEPADTVIIIDGTAIPLKACVETNKKIMGSAVDPIAFCKCLIPKFYADLQSDPEKLKLLKEGNWFELPKDKQQVVSNYYQDCITQAATTDSTAKFTITPRMFETIKKKMKMELSGTTIEKTNNVDKYCDCMINSLQTDFTVKEIMQPNFSETEKYQQVQARCLRTTKKR